MKYIFINPVVDRMYEKASLDQVLLEKGYQRVEVETDWHALVKEKYNELLKQTNLTVIDKRCPKAIEAIDTYINNEKMVIPSIDPILIHCGIELSNREELKGVQKIITTPCESLAHYGNKLQLLDTEFISWKQFLAQLDPEKKLQVKSLGASPIPPGYFETLDVKVSSISGKEEIENHFKTESYVSDEIVEMLYCHNGCHNGDGVLIDE